jgi:two-component sensor histidine kinase
MVVLDAILLVLSFILTAGFALIVKPRRRELVSWALGYASLLAGVVLFGLRDLIPDILSIVFANTLIISFLAFVVVGIDYFRGRKPRFALLGSTVALVFLWFLAFGIAWPMLPYRFTFYNLAVAALSVAGALSIVKGAGRGSHAVQAMAVGILSCVALLNLSRLYLGSGGLPEDIMDSATWEGLIQAASGTLITILCFTLLLMHERRENQELARIARDKELLVREMAHRTKNDLALVDGLISLERDALTDGERGDDRVEGVAGRLDALRERIRCVADAHDRLSRSEDLGVIRLDGYLEAIASSLPTRPGIEVERELDPAVASFGFAAPLGLAMNELATNALKHAFPEGSGGRVRISFKTSAAEGGGVAALLVVRDDGVGAAWPPEKPGLGAMIVESFARKLGGKLDYAFDGGSVFTLSFVIPPEQARGASAR